MLSKDEKALADKLWFTFKARIRAFERLNSNNFHSQLMLVWYALVSAVLSVIVIRHQTYLGSDTDIISAALSIALLVLSLLVTNLDFKGRALAFRQSYLDIQGLYHDLTFNDAPAKAPTDIIKRYQEILNESENHLEIDDKYFRVFTKGTTRPASNREVFEVYMYLAVRFMVFLILYIAPALVFAKFGF